MNSQCVCEAALMPAAGSSTKHVIHSQARCRSCWPLRKNSPQNAPLWFHSFTRRFCHLCEAEWSNCRSLLKCLTVTLFKTPKTEMIHSQSWSAALPQRSFLSSVEPANSNAVDFIFFCLVCSCRCPTVQFRLKCFTLGFWDKGDNHISSTPNRVLTVCLKGLENYVALWSKLVLQSQWNRCGVWYPSASPPEQRSPVRVSDPAGTSTVDRGTILIRF